MLKTYKTSALQNAQASKRPRPKTSKLQNVQASKRPSLKTSKPQYVPNTKRPKYQNVQASKQPSPKTSKPQKVQAPIRPSLLWKNLYICTYFINKDGTHFDLGMSKILATSNSQPVYWAFYMIYNKYHTMYTSFIQLTYIQHIHSLDDIHSM